VNERTSFGVQIQPELDAHLIRTGVATFFENHEDRGNREDIVWTGA